MSTNNQLNSISLLAFSFVAIIVVVNLLTTNNYGKANNQVVKAIAGKDNNFSYHDLKAIANGNQSVFQLVDLRSEAEFAEGHLPGAINVPFDQIIDRSSLRKIRKTGKTPVLYAERESLAHTARMLLLSKGFDGELQIMGGTYQTAVEFAIENFSPAMANYKEEKARFDFVRFMRAGSEPDARQRPASIIPARVEVTSAAGGC